MVMQSPRLNCPAGGTPANMTLMEVMPAPLGVSLGPSSSHISVAVSGHAPVSGLTGGRLYYATSTGHLLEGTYVGWTQCRVSAASDACKEGSGEDIVSGTVNGQDVLVLASNRVGLALGDGTLLM